MPSFANSPQYAHNPRCFLWLIDRSVPQHEQLFWACPARISVPYAFVAIALESKRIFAWPIK